MAMFSGRADKRKVEGNGELLMMAAAEESLILSRKHDLFFQTSETFLATRIHLAHSINDGGGRVRTIS